ncbi:cytochrome d ubiquinol oxidase subunit II [Paenibacillus sedimenti]|uniref:Cytochrome d ubiquinol oxidase subunit II n=1 Tax=Paenibacillus sedimenti TaxID=2770274 RepID=A0A926KQY6_9BACL|nr:cytochrome d ubiquinol oxidase subunit II [Paenibacillus sedimenti]MBD0381526.1 cytochrome d ubiquinol oxidase subunit II [Paenibacillus sedimenti]
MNLEVAGITVLWTFLYGYLIVASIDFGAGFFSYYSYRTKKEHLIQNIIKRYLSPVWEVTNVFLIFFIVGIVGFFPDTAYYYGTALLVPGSVAIVLLAVRGSYYAFSTYGTKSRQVYVFLYGATGLLIPASLSTVLTISEGGFIEIHDGKVVFLFQRLFFSLYSWSVVLLAIVSVLYISAMFLTFYAAKAKDIPALEIVRRWALIWSTPTIVCSLIVFYSINLHNPEHFQHILELSWMFACSFLFFLAAVYLVWRKKNYGISFILVMFQFAFAFYGYGAAHLPYILYPYLSIYEHFTNKAMGIALIIAFLAGLLLLIPSLFLLMRLFLFNVRYVQGRMHPKGD